MGIPYRFREQNILNSIDGLLNYFTAPNIRDKVIY